MTVSTNPIGQTIGRYEIVSPLGQGGMATVYKAYDSRLDRHVAIKVLHNKENDETFLVRFIREAKALAHLSHPNIVKVLDFGDEDGVPYLVMEYINGGTLKDHMGVPAPWREACRMIIPITHALYYAHSQNIIHRDVKPANILVADSGHLMLSDFGIAKTIGQQATSELTGTGFGIGTPHYMAPEQGLGKKLDGRADIYSLGVILFELVTGKLPYDADTPMAVMLKHITETVPIPREIIPDIPEDFQNTLLRSLAKAPEDRFLSMTDFGATLERLASGSSQPSISKPFVQPVQHAQDIIPATQLVEMEKPVVRVKQPGKSKTAVRWILTFLGVMVAAILVGSILLSIGGAILISNLIQSAFSTMDYTFLDTGIERSEFLTEEEASTSLNASLDMFTADWISNMEVNFQNPDRAFLTAETTLGPANIEIKITEKNGKPEFSLRKYNKFPLILVGGILSRGINDGLSTAMDDAEFQISNLEITNSRISYDIEPLN